MSATPTTGTAARAATESVTTGSIAVLVGVAFNIVASRYPDIIKPDMAAVLAGAVTGVIAAGLGLVARIARKWLQKRDLL